MTKKKCCWKGEQGDSNKIYGENYLTLRACFFSYTFLVFYYFSKLLHDLKSPRSVKPQLHDMSNN